MTSWDSVLLGMKTEPTDDVKEELFLQQLSGSQALKDEISHYHRAERGERDKSYDFLRRSVVKYLDRRRQDENRKAVARGLGGGRPPASALPAAAAKGGNGDDKKKIHQPR